MEQQRQVRECPECHQETLVWQKHVHRTVVGGVTATDGTSFAWVCRNPACEEVELTGAELRKYEQRAAAIILREVPSARGAVARFARKALGLRQADLASLLGYGPERVSRWETDTEPMKKPTRLALVALLEGVLAGRLDLKRALERARAPEGEEEVPTTVEVPEPCPPATSSAA